MNRRRFLTATSSTTIVLGSGCLSGSDEENAGGDDPETESQTDVGSTITTDGAELTFKEVELATEVVSKEGETYEADEGDMWVLAKVKTTNSGDENRDLPYMGNFKLVAENSQYDPVDSLDLYSPGFPLSEPVSGEQYSSVSDARPDVSREGWLVYSVPDSVESATLSWAGSGSYEDGEGEAEWNLSLNPSELPDVGFAGLNISNSAEVGEEITAEVLLENAGGSEYTVESALDVEYPDGTDESKPFEAIVPAEDKASVSFSFESLAVGSFTFVLEDYNVSKSSDVRPATTTFDEDVSVDGLPQISISEPVVTDSYVYEDFHEEPVTEDADGTFVFFECEARNSSSDHMDAPEDSDFHLSVDGSEHDTTSIDSMTARGYLEPFEGTLFDPYSGISSGDTEEGIIHFEIPGSVSEDDIELIADWSLGFGNGNTSIRWSK